MKVGEIYVFEMKNSNIKKISIGFTKQKEADSFIEMMSESRLYKSINTNVNLIAAKILIKKSIETSEKEKYAEIQNIIISCAKNCGNTTPTKGADPICLSCGSSVTIILKE